MLSWVKACKFKVNADKADFIFIFCSKQCFNDFLLKLLSAQSFPFFVITLVCREPTSFFVLTFSVRKLKKITNFYSCPDVTDSVTT